MVEEQIDKLTIAVETVGGDNKSLGDLRKQLEKLGRVDLSGTIRQLGDLRAALGHLGTVDESVKSMLDNMAKLGLRANGVSGLKKQLDDVRKSATQTKEEIAEVIDRAMRMQTASPNATVTGEAPRREPMSNKKAYGYDQSAIDYIEEYAKSLDSVDKKHRKNAASAQKMGESAKAALDKTDSAAKKAHKSTSKLGDAFVRIVRFKIAAAVMQSVINSFKEGTTALGAFDAESKDVLDTYAAASKAAGAGLTLSIVPALEAAAPLVEYIADGIGSIGNGISMITALIKGEDEYRAVRPVEQIKAELAAAEKKAEDLRQLISGFDELNIFSAPKETETPDIDIFEMVEFRDEAGKLNKSLLEDLATLGEFAAVAGAAALAVGFLKNAFSGKNKTLKDQTKLTGDDVKETVKLKDIIDRLAPSVDGVTAALGILGGMALPALDPTGITVPAGEAAGALDVLGAKQPAPAIDTAPLLEGVGAMDARVKEFVTAEYAPITLSASDRQLIEDLRTATEQITVFAEGLSPAFDTEYGEIKRGYGDLMGGMLDMTQKTTGTLGVNFGAVFDDVETDWATTMGAMLDLSLTAFDNVKSLWNSTIADLQTAWDRQFAGGLSVNVNGAGATTTKEANPTANAGIVMPGKSDVEIEYIVPENTTSEFDRVIAQNRAKKNAVGVITKVAGGAAAGLSAVGGLGGVMLPNLTYKNLYANGGLVSSGEVFIARENGMPEFVGSFGGQTGVANNEQIVSGIAGGVESALAAYVPQIIRAIEENATAVNIGDDQIARAAQRGNRRYMQTTGHSMF